MKFSLRTKNEEKLQSLSAASDEGAPDVSVQVENSRRTPGISQSELLINIAISIGTGVPAGIAANWLFAKLGLGRDTKLYDQMGELIATVQELQAKIEELSAEKKAGK